MDPKTTDSILDLIRAIHGKIGITVILITHQMSVVERICNKVAILDHGSVAESGTVTEIFANPQSDAAKRLVVPDRASANALHAFKPGRAVISVSFNDAQATDTPLIALLAKEKGIEASILAARTSSIGGRAFGKMLLGVEDKDGKVTETLQFMNAVPRVKAEVVSEEEWRKDEE